MNARNASAEPEEDRAVAVAVPIAPEVIAAYEAMIESVPDAGGEGMDNILAQIAAAQSPGDIDAPWRTTGLAGYAGRVITVRGIRKVPSDFPDGLPWFIVIDAVDPDTGELVTITTGAVSVVAQLVKAHNLDAFPLRVIPRQSDRPSRNGYFPQHLEVYRDRVR